MSKSKGQFDTKLAVLGLDGSPVPYKVQIMNHSKSENGNIKPVILMNFFFVKFDKLSFFSGFLLHGYYSLYCTNLGTLIKLIGLIMSFIDRPQPLRVFQVGGLGGITTLSPPLRPCDGLSPTKFPANNRENNSVLLLNNSLMLSLMSYCFICCDKHKFCLLRR